MGDDGHVRSRWDSLSSAQRAWWDQLPEWVWCLHCEHVWYQGDLLVGGGERGRGIGCGAADCHGGALDRRDYAEMCAALERFPKLDAITSGQHVPMYP
jgi:hypothetical protein